VRWTAGGRPLLTAERDVLSWEVSSYRVSTFRTGQYGTAERLLEREDIMLILKPGLVAISYLLISQRAISAPYIDIVIHTQTKNNYKRKIKQITASGSLA
jgi:hypothetical protein